MRITKKQTRLRVYVCMQSGQSLCYPLLKTCNRQHKTMFASLCSRVGPEDGLSGDEIHFFRTPDRDFRRVTHEIYFYFTYPYQPVGKIKTNSRMSVARWAHVDP